MRPESELRSLKADNKKHEAVVQKNNNGLHFSSSKFFFIEMRQNWLKSGALIPNLKSVFFLSHQFKEINFTH